MQLQGSCRCGACAINIMGRRGDSLEIRGGEPLREWHEDAPKAVSRMSARVRLAGR
jgi:hypothetical protein